MSDNNWVSKLNARREQAYRDLEERKRAEADRLVDPDTGEPISEDQAALNEAIERDPEFQRWIDDGGFLQGEQDLELSSDVFADLRKAKREAVRLAQFFPQPAPLTPEQMALINQPPKPFVDMVNHPPHYTSPAHCKNCGAPIECIQITRHLPFNLGNALKYIWRAGFGGKKNVDPVEDLRKSVWYLNDEINERVEQELED